MPARVRAREAAAAEVLRLLELASHVGPEELRRASVRHAVEVLRRSWDAGRWRYFSVVRATT